MRFLGIDQSLSHPAFVVLDEVGNVLKVDSRSVGRDLRGGERLTLIAQRLGALLAEHPYGGYRGCLEGPSLGSTHREFDLGEVSGVMKYVAWTCGIDLVVVPPTSLKLFATGKGLHASPPSNPRASKIAVIHAVNSVWGVDFRDVNDPTGHGDGDDNAADAYVLARMAYAMDARVFERRCEAEAVRALTAPPKKKKSRRSRLGPSTNI